MSTNNLIAALRQEQHVGLAATQDNINTLSGIVGQTDQRFDKMQNMMENMMQMFQVSRQDSVDRENIMRDEITAAIVPVTAQVESLTTTVQVLRNQLSSNADFSADAMQQIRAEFKDVKQ